MGAPADDGWYEASVRHKRNAGSVKTGFPLLPPSHVPWAWFVALGQVSRPLDRRCLCRTCDRDGDTDSQVDPLETPTYANSVNYRTHPLY